MKLIYFSRSYTGHDFRFVSELKKKYTIYYLMLEYDERVYESRLFQNKVYFIDWPNLKKKNLKSVISKNIFKILS